MDNEFIKGFKVSLGALAACGSLGIVLGVVVFVGKSIYKAIEPIDEVEACAEGLVDNEDFSNQFFGNQRVSRFGRMRFTREYCQCIIDSENNPDLNVEPPISIAIIYFIGYKE